MHRSRSPAAVQKLPRVWVSWPTTAWFVHQFDALALAMIVGVAIGVAWWSRLPWLWTNIFVLGVPLAFLLRRPEIRWQVRPDFVILLTIFAVVAFDSLAERYGGWRAQTAAPGRLPADVTLEEIEWTALYFPLVVALSARFFPLPRPRPQPVARGVLEAAFMAGLLVAILPIAQPLFTDYVYVKAGAMIELPVIVLAVWIDRRVAASLLRLTLAVVGFVFVYELLALENDYWSFAGSYVGTVQVGAYSFPLEELWFLVVLSAPAIASAAFVYESGPQSWQLWRAGARALARAGYPRLTVTDQRETRIRTTGS